MTEMLRQRHQIHFFFFLFFSEQDSSIFGCKWRMMWSRWSVKKVPGAVKNKKTKPKMHLCLVTLKKWEKRNHKTITFKYNLRVSYSFVIKDYISIYKNRSTSSIISLIIIAGGLGNAAVNKRIDKIDVLLYCDVCIIWTETSQPSVEE